MNDVPRPASNWVLHMIHINTDNWQKKRGFFLFFVFCFIKLHLKIVQPTREDYALNPELCVEYCCSSCTAGVSSAPLTVWLQANLFSDPDKVWPHISEDDRDGSQTGRLQVCFPSQPTLNKKQVSVSLWYAQWYEQYSWEFLPDYKELH